MKDKEKKSTGDIGLVDEVLELCKNLTSIESHAFSSYLSSKDEKYFKIVNKARKMRTRYLSLIAKSEFQTWCISKHLCEAMMRLQECTTRFISSGQLKEAKICSENYFDLFSLFLVLNGYRDISGEPSTSP